MNSIRNAFLRELLRIVFFFLAKVIQVENWLVRKRNNHFSSNTMPSGFENQKERLQRMARQSGEKIFIAQTSGTRNVPKTVPYTATRMKLVQKTFLKSMITLTSPYRGRKTFFVFSSVDDDSSLTSGMLQDKEPNLVELLQAPYRFLTTPAGHQLRREIGLLSTRVALIAVTSPRFFYATNPSTLTHFLDEVQNEWPLIRESLKKCLKNSELLRLTDGSQRLEKLIQEEKFSLEALAPDLIGMITWDGGYVAPFLERLREKYPKLVFIPMYSMSTETIETLPHRVKGKLHFLPTMKGVAPEFLKDGEIVRELEVNETYTLIISDIWGLDRYDTQDEFEVVGFVNGLPDLRFKRRRNVTASMTGEKISEDQCLLLYQKLRKRFGLEDLYLSLYGRMLGDQAQYVLNLIGPKKEFPQLEVAANEILCSINSEYSSKIQSGRLLPLKVEALSVSAFAELMGQKVKWESQFKVMPLYEKPLR
ncbi:GH3 family domain-containing protein [Peredibacter starrii]|uniref:GH3 auxin-responsive promoter family protein n=1 Tax=Peredibacter starrii TaxID=28202 RepID=A0AAX4HUX6_9BACT|nr:GH3 auxin-responsive promoter family protein [Peredibacter starrii]WPU66942.1 GH3 auxin-responsive promoter family protein [Peredibacter starrii]